MFGDPFERLTGIEGLFEFLKAVCFERRNRWLEVGWLRTFHRLTGTRVIRIVVFWV